MAVEEGSGTPQISEPFIRPPPSFDDYIISGEYIEPEPPAPPDPFITFVKDLTGRIRWMNEWVIKRKIEAAEQVTAIYSKPGNWAAKIGAAIAIALVGVVSFVMIKEIMAIAVVVQFVEAVGGVIKGIMGFIRLDWIESFLQILAIVWPQFRAAWKDFYASLGALSQTLGSSVSFIPLLISNIESVAVASGKLIGRTPRETRIAYLEDAADWTQGIVDNLAAWAAKPEKIMDNLYQKVVSKWTNLSNPDNINVIETIVSLEEGADQLIENVDGLAVSVNRLIQDLPEDAFSDLQDAVTFNWKQYIEFKETYVEPFQEITDIVITDIQTELGKQLALLETLTDRKDFTVLELINMMLETGVEGDRARAIWALLTNMSLLPTEDIDDTMTWKEIIALYGDQVIPDDRPPIVPYVLPVWKVPTVKPPPMLEEAFADTVSGLIDSGSNRGPMAHEPWGVKV